MRLICLQHFEPEEPGLILQWAADRRVPYETVHLYKGEALPEVAADDLVAVMGGPMNVDETDKYPWLLPERDYLKAFADRGGRIFGVCLGSQLLARALGASVRRNHCKEIGWHPVSYSPDALSAGVFAGLPASMHVLHWHGDTWDLPDGAVLAASSPQCRNQAFVAGEGRLVGLQYHMEAEPHLIHAFVDCFDDELKEGGPHVQSGSQIIGEMPRHMPECRKTLYTLLDRWAQLESETTQAVSDGSSAG